jgi:DNA-binding MarR family transcriptional regulator
MNSSDILVALRRIMRAIDLRSKKLQKLAGLTVPQLVVMQAVRDAGELTVSEVARRVSLSQGTVTSVLQRLELKGLICRERGSEDRRKVFIVLTPAGREKLANSPELLQEEFISRFEELADWEQKMLISALERIATIMDAETVDASPILEIGDIVAEPSLQPQELPKKS